MSRNPRRDRSQNLSSFAIVAFSFIQFLLAWTYVRVYVNLFGLHEGFAIRAVFPTLIYALAAIAIVRLFQGFLRTDLWFRSPFYCSGSRREF